jgi:hypothetical protein
MSNRWLRHWWRQHNHRHDFAFHAFKLPRPEGGTYYQLRCTHKGCYQRNGEKRFKPQQIMAPCVMYTIKVPLDLMPMLNERSQQQDVAQVDYLGRIIRKDLVSNGR